MDRFSISRLLESAAVEATPSASLLPIDSPASGASSAAGEAAAMCDQQALLWASALGLAALHSPQTPTSAQAQGPARFGLPTGPIPNPLQNASSSAAAAATATTNAQAFDQQTLAYLTYLAYFLTQLGPNPLSDASFCATPTSSTGTGGVGGCPSGSASSASASFASSTASAASPTMGSSAHQCLGAGDFYGLSSAAAAAAAASLLCPEHMARTPMECSQPPPTAAFGEALRSPSSCVTDRSHLMGSESSCAPGWSAMSSGAPVPSRLQRKQQHQQQHQQQLLYQTLLWQQVRLPLTHVNPFFSFVPVSSILRNILYVHTVQ